MGDAVGVAARPQRRDVLHLGLGVVKAPARVDHGVGPAPSSRIGIARPDRLEGGLRHAGRASTRARCTSGGAVTTSTPSHRPARRSRRAAGYRGSTSGASAWRSEKRPGDAADQRMTECASSLASPPRGPARCARRPLAINASRPGASVPGTRRRSPRRLAARPRRGRGRPRRRRGPARRRGGNIWAVADLPMPIEPVSPRTTRRRSRGRATQIRERCGAQARRPGARRTRPRTRAPPGGAACRARRRSRRPRAAARGEQRRLERHVDDVGDRGLGRQRAEVERERRLARHAERGGVDHEPGPARSVGQASQSTAARRRPRRAPVSRPARGVRLATTDRGEAALAQADDDRAGRAAGPEHQRAARPRPAGRRLWSRLARKPSGRCWRRGSGRRPRPPACSPRRSFSARGVSAVGERAKAASLCGMVTLPPAKPPVQAARRKSSNASGARRSRS